MSRAYFSNGILEEQVEVVFWKEDFNLGVSKNRETPQNGRFIMENPMNKWMIWGENPLFLETSI